MCSPAIRLTYLSAQHYRGRKVAYCRIRMRAYIGRLIAEAILILSTLSEVRQEELLVALKAAAGR